MNKPFHSLAVLKESYNYLLKHFSLMKYYWIAVISTALIAFHKQLGDKSALASVIHSVIGIVLAAMGVALIRLIVKGERMSWHSIFKQFFENHFWRYLGTAILGSLLMVLPIVFMLLGLLVVGVTGVSDFGVLPAVMHALGSSGGGVLLMIVLGIIYIAYVVCIICWAAIGMVHAASGGRKSIRTAYHLMRGVVVRFYGGLLLAYIPSGLMYGIMHVYLGSVDGGSVAVASIASYLVLAVLAVFLALLVSVYSAKYYKAIQER